LAATANIKQKGARLPPPDESGGPRREEVMVIIWNNFKESVLEVGQAIWNWTTKGPSRDTSNDIHELLINVEQEYELMYSPTATFEVCPIAVTDMEVTR